MSFERMVLTILNNGNLLVEGEDFYLPTKEEVEEVMGDESMLVIERQESMLHRIPIDHNSMEFFLFRYNVSSPVSL